MKFKIPGKKLSTPFLGKIWSWINFKVSFDHWMQFLPISFLFQAKYKRNKKWGRRVSILRENYRKSTVRFHCLCEAKEKLEFIWKSFLAYLILRFSYCLLKNWMNVRVLLKRKIRVRLYKTSGYRKFSLKNVSNII